MSSKETSLPYSVFRSRMKETLVHLEGIGACIDLASQILQDQNDRKTSIGEALTVSKKRQKRLRMPVLAKHGFINQLRRRNCEYVFHVVYTYFSEYIRRILRAMYDHNPMMVVGKSPGKLDYHEVPKLGSYNSISDYVVEQVFRRLEATRSSTQLLERILDHTDVVIPEDKLKKAMLFIEARHLIVHNSGIIDAAFVRRFGDLNSLFVGGSKLSLSIGFAQSGIKAMNALIESIDIQLVLYGLVSSAYNQRLKGVGE